jgi:hypothetical protein
VVRSSIALTHHVHILELNCESYRLKQSKARRRREAQLADLAAAAADPETGEITSASLKAASALAAKPRPSPPAQTQRVELYNSVNWPGFPPPR